MSVLPELDVGLLEGALSRSSAAALVIATAFRSLTFVWKMTLLPSFHISVTRVSPGRTVPAKRTLIFLNGPYFW